MPEITEFPPQLSAPPSPIVLDGGRVQSIAVHPTDPHKVIAASQFGGLWATEDAGASWFHLDGLETVFALDVAYAPDSNTLLATLARDNKTDNGGGIWRSPDGGSTWTRPPTSKPPLSVRTPSRSGGYAINYAPDNANRVYVGTDYGVAVSADNGNTWSHKMLETASAVSSDRRQNAVVSILALPLNRVIALCRTGVYRTDDGGDSWRQVRAGDHSGQLVWFKCIDCSPVDSDKVFILQGYSALRLYEVETEQWTTVPLPGGASRGPFVRLSRSLAGADSFDIWVGAGVNLLKTTCVDIDAARKIADTDWTVLWRPAGLHDDSGHLGLDADRRPVMYGSDGGIFKPTNADATTWTPAAGGGSGLNSYLITDLAGTNVGPAGGATSNTSLYFTTQDNQIWASANNGMSWPVSDCAEGFYLSAPQDAVVDADVTIAYGKIGCGPSTNMFSDANLAHPRAVPDVDTAGAILANTAQAFLISPGNWIRSRFPPGGDVELYVSQTNGSSWRLKARVTLQTVGIVSVAGAADNPTIYLPVRGARTGPDGAARIGLLKLKRVFNPGIVTYDDGDVIYLPDEGSLGLRATEFDWHAVFGIDPNDPDYIIAPDIHNQIVKVSTNGGGSWFTDTQLTSEVTQGGQLLLYDDDPYHMQVTRVAFDPYDADGIVIGTRDAGVIMSRDRGNTWTTIGESTAIRYVTSFFFRRDETTLVSSYGRGLWEINFRIEHNPFPPELFCYPCIFRDPRDPGIVSDPPGWQDLDVTVFMNGHVNGLALAGGTVETITVSPGTRWRRYLGSARIYPKLNVLESDVGQGFDGLAGCAAALQNGETIRGLILRGSEIVGIISGDGEYTGAELRAGGSPVNNQPADAPAAPYVRVSTNLAIAGAPVLDSDGMIHVAARGFAFDPAGTNTVVVLVDDLVVEQAANVMQNGTVAVDITMPDDLSYGEHSVRVMQTVGGQSLAARSMFVKAAVDED